LRRKLSVIIYTRRYNHKKHAQYILNIMFRSVCSWLF